MTTTASERAGRVFVDRSSRPPQTAADSHRLKSTVIALLIATAIEGGLRKWLLPSALQGAAYFAKDIIAVVLVIQNKPRSEVARSIQTLSLLCASLLSLALILGAPSDPVAAGVIFKNAVLWPLVGARVIDLDKDGFRTLLRVVAVLTILQGAVAVIQYLSPPSSPINRYVYSDDAAEVATFGRDGLVRATGTFSYISGLGIWSSVASTLLICSVSRGARNPDTRLHVMGACGGLIALVCTASRTALVIVILSVAVAVIAAFRVEALGRLTAACAVFLGIFLISSGVSTIVTNFADRITENEEEATTRVAFDPLDLWKTLLDAPLGDGLGSWSSIRSIRASQNGDTQSTLDDNRTRIAAEAGFPGILTLIAQLLMTADLSVRGLRISRGRDRFLMAGVSTAALIVCYQGAQIYDHVSAAVFWTIICAGLGAARREQNGTRSTSPMLERPATLSPAT